MREDRDHLTLVAADAGGRIFDLPGIDAAGRSGGTVMPLRRSECIPLPKGSELFSLPGRLPIGFEGGTGEPVEVGDGEVSAAAAFLAPAHTQLFTAPYETAAGKGPAGDLGLPAPAIAQVKSGVVYWGDV